MTGNKKLDRILMALNLVVILGALGLVVKAHYFSDPPPIDPKMEELALEQDIKNSQNIKLFKLEKLIINLPVSSKRLRYLELIVHLRPLKNSLSGRLEEKKTQIIDAIISIAGKMEPEQLATLAGKILLEEKLKNKINSFFRTPTVGKIFYSKFVIQ